MPRTTRIALRAALIYLVVGAAAGALHWIDYAWRPWPEAAGVFSAFSPTYVHLIVVGWLTQFIMGVMHWMFPIVSRVRPRGDERIVAAAFVLLNGGLVFRTVSEPWNALAPSDVMRVVLVASAVLQACGAALFAGTAWPRVRERGGF